MKTRPVLLMALLFLGACHKEDPPKHFDQLKLTYKKEGQTTQRQIPIVFALVDATTAGRTEIDRSTVVYAEHWFCLANYDLSEKPEKPNTNATKDVPPGADIAPVKACVTINDKAGTDGASPLQPGTYFVGLTEHMPDRIAGGGIFWDKGKLGASALLHIHQAEGSLRLDSVADDVVSGEIDLHDGDLSISGTFNLKATIIKRIRPPGN